MDKSNLTKVCEIGANVGKIEIGERGTLMKAEPGYMPFLDGSSSGVLQTSVASDGEATMRLESLAADLASNELQMF